MRHATQFHDHSHPGLAVGAALALTLLLVWFAWLGAQQVGQHLSFSLSHAAGVLPTMPHLPDGPKLPDAPIPMPK